MENIMEIRHFCKNYGEVKAVQDLVLCDSILVLVAAYILMDRLAGRCLGK